MARVNLAQRRPPTSGTSLTTPTPFTTIGQPAPPPQTPAQPTMPQPTFAAQPFTYRGQTPQAQIPQLPQAPSLPPMQPVTYRGNTYGQPPPVPTTVPPPVSSGRPPGYLDPQGYNPAAHQPPAPTPSAAGGGRAWPRNQPTFQDYVRDYWAPDRRDVLLRELTRDYWAPDRAAVISRYQTMGDAELWPHGRPGAAASSGGGNFDLPAFQNRWQELVGRYPGTVQGLAQLVADNPDLGIEIVGGSKGDIKLPNGQIVDVIYAAGEGGRGWQWLTDGGGGGGGNAPSGPSVPGPQFSDPYTAQLEQFLQQRFQQLLQPAYSGPELEILRTQALDPIERDRQAARKRALENISARGLTPESGVSLDLMNQVDAGFDRSRAGAQNQIAVQQIQEERSRQQEAQALLSLLYDLPHRAFQDSLAALGMGPTPESLFNQSLGLYNIGQQQRGQNAQWYQTLGSMLPYLFGGQR